MSKADEKKKTAFLMYYDYKPQLDLLTDRQLRKLIDAMFEYEFNGTVPKLDKVTNMAFMPIKSRLDKDKEAFEQRCKKNKENIEKYWKKVKGKKTTEYDRIPNDTNATDNDSECDSEYDSDSECECDKDIDNNYTIRHTPTLAEILDYSLNNKIGNEHQCEKFYNWYEAKDWEGIKNWKNKFRYWVLSDEEKEAKKKVDDGPVYLD